MRMYPAFSYEPSRKSQIRPQVFDHESHCSQSQQKLDPLFFRAWGPFLVFAIARLSAHRQIGPDDRVLSVSLAKRMRRTSQGTHLIPGQPSCCLSLCLPVPPRHRPSFHLEGLSHDDRTLNSSSATRMIPESISSHLYLRQLLCRPFLCPPSSCFPRGLHCRLRKTRSFLKWRRDSCPIWLSIET
jgi:hypothetical protein